MPPRGLQYLPTGAKLYFKNADGTWVEVQGLIESIELSVNNVTQNTLPTTTIEMSMTGGSILQTSEVPPEDCYEEWERMVLKGIQ